MEITVTKDGNAAMLSLKGQFGTEAVPAFVAELGGLGDITELALDLDGLTYLSTAGLGEIVRAQKKIGQRGSFSLIRVPTEIADLFRMTGLYGRMDIYEKE